MTARNTPDATSVVRLRNRFPFADDGIAHLNKLLDLTAIDVARLYGRLGQNGIAREYHGAMELLRMLNDIVRANLNRETRNRFTSQGSNAVEVAARAHAREHPDTVRVIGDLRAHTEALVTPPEWERDLLKRQERAEKARLEFEDARDHLNRLIAEREAENKLAREALQAFEERRAARGEPRYLTRAARPPVPGDAVTPGTSTAIPSEV